MRFALTSSALELLETESSVEVARRALGSDALARRLLEVPAGADTRNIGAVEGKRVRRYCCTTN